MYILIFKKKNKKKNLSMNSFAEKQWEKMQNMYSF